MMTDHDARKALKNLVEKFLDSSPDQNTLISIIEVETRPALPVRGVLEEMRKYRSKEYSDDDKKTIDELLYLYG